MILNLNLHCVKPKFFVINPSIEKNGLELANNFAIVNAKRVADWKELTTKKPITEQIKTTIEKIPWMCAINFPPHSSFKPKKVSTFGTLKAWHN